MPLHVPFPSLFLFLLKDVAAAKIQSLQRAKQAKPASGQGNMSGGSLEEVFNSFCATYRQTTMTNTVFVSPSLPSSKMRLACSARACFLSDLLLKDVLSMRRVCFSVALCVLTITRRANFSQAKFCKDAKILDSKFSKPDIDMVWSKVAGKEKKVSYSLFVKFLEEIAKKKGVEYAEVEGHVMTNAQVSSSGTTGESRFYDDKSTWTGAAVKGGPTTNDNTITLQNLTANK